MNALGPQACALAAVLLALPFLSPVSMGALTAPASLAIAALAVSLIRGSHELRLPDRILRLRISPRLHAAMVAVVRRIERYVGRSGRRPTALVAGRRGRLLCGSGILVGAALLAIPIPFLPLTNTVPSIAIVCFGIGWAEQDGSIALAGVLAAVVAVLLFAGLGIALTLFGEGAVDGLLSWSRR